MNRSNGSIAPAGLVAITAGLFLIVACSSAQKVAEDAASAAREAAEESAREEAVERLDDVADDARERVRDAAENVDLDDIPGGEEVQDIVEGRLGGGDDDEGSGAGTSGQATGQQALTASSQAAPSAAADASCDPNQCGDYCLQARCLTGDIDSSACLENCMTSCGNGQVDGADAAMMACVGELISDMACTQTRACCDTYGDSELCP